MKARLKTDGTVYDVIKFENIGTPNEVVVLDDGSGGQLKYRTTEVDIL